MFGHSLSICAPKRRGLKPPKRPNDKPSPVLGHACGVHGAHSLASRVRRLSERSRTKRNPGRDDDDDEDEDDDDDDDDNVFV